MIALGVDVAMYPDADAFAVSDDSLLDPDTSVPADPVEPVDEADDVLDRPVRMAAESLFSYGLLNPDAPDAHARLYGTVLHAEQHTVEATEQGFIVARVRTVGCEVDVCLPDKYPIPDPGAIVGGTVFLVASIPSLETSPQG